MCTACFLRTCTADKDNRKWPNSDRRGNYICTQVTNKLTPASWHEARNSCWGIHLRLLTAPVQVRIFYLSFIAGMSSTGDAQSSYYVSKQTKLERSLSFCRASTSCRDNAKRQQNGWRNCFIVGQSSWTKLHLLIPSKNMLHKLRSIWFVHLGSCWTYLGGRGWIPRIQMSCWYSSHLKTFWEKE
jgi:hypothetical protein